MNEGKEQGLGIEQVGVYGISVQYSRCCCFFNIHVRIGTTVMTMMMIIDTMMMTIMIGRREIEGVISDQGRLDAQSLHFELQVGKVVILLLLLLL